MSHMTEEERFKQMKKEISGSVNAFKDEMNAIIGQNDSELSSSDDDHQQVISKPVMAAKQKETGQLSQPVSIQGQSELGKV